MHFPVCRIAKRQPEALLRQSETDVSPSHVVAPTEPAGLSGKILCVGDGRCEVADMNVLGGEKLDA